MKTNSNSYTIIYSVIIVVIVAFLLAFVSSSLKTKQDANVALDTQKQILNSLNLRDLDNATAAAKYKEVVSPASFNMPRSFLIFSNVYGINFCPPNPGFTDIIRNISASFKIQESVSTGVAGFNATAALAPVSLIWLMVRSR